MPDPTMICAALQPVCGFINQAGVPAATAKHVASFACIKRNLRDLTKAMEDLQALEKVVQGQVILETNNLNECHPQVSLWLTRVVDVLVDPIGRECDQLMQSSCFCSSALSLGKRYRLGKRVVEMLEYLDRLIKEGSQFETFASKRLPDFVEERPRTQTFGIEPVLRDFRKSFETNDVKIIGIWGPGGVGKTTLLNTFNNELKAWGRDYQVVIMIEVSNSGTLNKAAIQRTITDRLGLPWNDIDTEEARARSLANALRRKKFVILLDDVRNKFQLEDVGIPTPDSESKSKLILTSRYENVCYQMGANQSLIKMEYLEKEAAWELFRSNLSTQAIAAIESPGPNNIVKEHADAIVHSCGGLPLALKVIGRAVAGLTEPREWSLAMQATKDDIKDLDGIPEMFHKLKYSYDKLTPMQQQCFLYCTLFPEYGSINKDQLVEYWMAEELIPQDKKGHHIIRSLLSACLLECCGSESEVKMHHIIRQLGLSLAAQQNIVVKAGMSLEKAPPHREWRRATRISLMYNDIRSLDISPKCKHLVTFLVQNNPNLDRMSQTFFQHMNSLRVLDLSHTSITTLPLCRSLAKLKYLNLSHTFIERLPEEFWVLKELIHLDLSVTKALKDTFDNCSKLHRLRVLNLFRSNYGVRDVTDLNIDSLKELEFLGITIYAEDVLKKLTKTHPLAKSTQRLSLKHCGQMQSIQISDCAHMVQLGELYVESCLDLKQLIADPDKRRTSRLQVLTLAELPALQTIVIGSSPHHFRNLLQITISHCQKLHDITWVLKLEALEKLSICHCHELEQVVQETFNKVDNRSGAIEQRSIQRRGRKYGFSEEQETHGMVDDAYIEYVKGYLNMTKSWQNNGIVQHPGFTKLRSLVLTGLPKLTVICNPRDFPSLEIIRVEGCPRLRTLPLGQMDEWTKLKQICGSYDWWERLEWSGKETMENKYFIPI
ncbi:disease resistance protein RPS2-like [Phragmites australis]|uniref:disease resistance protein RPS2-like n=1 Tax=Phragmites australis TaxID=29695 RepID=UPI002D778244|nr:disease resistance protein RPS2-like [Phragmites australis]